ncbi:DUF86 domain-containing protein [Chroococcus sp. FPU101]|uniref:HepT-like ribonuclease domain-containing protein n=1 Tax=Chroococcus sp. FPU101 TaxID=1974212 RepID=UPI001A8EC6D7|nr:HepT-like ribonuclease domain-containing protein [Chroococcus sp. FPU101]GFE71230.1 protein of unknown function DUF86 [Chroococcus sp. FPU101]
MSIVDDLSRLYHMKDAAEEILDFMAGKIKEHLTRERMLALAVVKDLEIIGEAVSKISVECRNRHPTILWNEMIGMRNRLVHAYYGINFDIVWETVQNNLLP